MGTLVVVGTLFVQPPNALVTASIETEYFSYLPNNQSRSEINLPAARVEEPDGRSVCKRDLRLRLWNDGRPVEATVRQYQTAPHRLEITFDGSPVEVSLDEAHADRALNVAVLVVDSADESCRALQPLRLELLGFVTVGEAGGADVLRSATINVFGRTHARIGPVPTHWFPSLESHALYLADTIILPAGSEIICAAARQTRASVARTMRTSENCPEKIAGRGKLDVATWWGFADIDLGDPTRSMNLEIASNAQYVFFTPPAPPAIAPARPDMVSLSLVSRVAGDPNNKIIGAALLAMIGLLAGMVQIVSWQRRTKE